MRESHYEKEKLSALEAIREAQGIAFGPMLFQATACLLDFGILKFLDGRKEGAGLGEIAKATGVSEYGAGVLLDMGLSGRVVLERGGKFFLAKTGHFLLHDRMTAVNFNFTKDVCYAGLGKLREAIAEGRPAGLEALGKWKTIYEGLSVLPEPARKSWFDFDHYYSDAAFDSVLPQVFELKPKVIYDVGGNTGKWALKCVGHDAAVKVTVLDLPQQVRLLRKNLEGKTGAERIGAVEVDVLGEGDLPGEADVWWMSQFLDCFSEEEIVRILKRVRRSLKKGAKLCVMELFCDRQRFEAAAFSLNAGSLYFTAMANGNSRFYRGDVMKRCIEAAGFAVEKEVDGVGGGLHTLLVMGEK